MAADGTIQIDINVNDNSAQNSINNLNNSANNAGKSFLSLGKVIAGIGAVVLSARLINSVKDFTVEAVKAAGAAQALNSQFSQVFGDLEDSATLALNSIAQETSILPERLKGSFVQIAAFARTAGFDNAAALDLSTRATLAAADSAAFYDRSIQSVTESLQSYLKGNFENDSALGISSTETTRNAKANELYGKSFKDLSEAQKQLTLLAQVEEGNKLSGALGQAAREGTGLENVTGNLSQAFENFKVAIGGNFLDLAVRGIIALTNAIQNINVDRISAGIQNVVENLVNVGRVVLPVVTSAFEVLRNAIDSAIQFVLPLIQNLRDTFDQNSDSIYSKVSEVFGNVREAITSAVNAILQFVQPQLERLSKFWEDNGEQILTAVRNAFNFILAVVEFVMPAIRLIIDVVWSAIKQIITGALDVILGAVRIFSGIFTGDFTAVWEGIKSIFSGAIDLILGITTLTFFGGLRTIFVNLGKAAVSIVKGLWDDIAKIFTNITTATVGTVRGFVDNVVNFFRTLVLKTLQLFLELRRDAVGYIDDLVKTAISSLAALPGKFLEIGKNAIQALIDGLKSLNPIGVISDIIGSVTSRISEGISAVGNFFGGNSSPSVSGATSPSGTSGVVTTNSSSSSKTQINNFNVQTNNQKVELERLARQNAFAF